MGTGSALKDFPANPNPLLIMTRNLAVSLLRQGATGDQILSILETIAADAPADADAAQPTAEEIQF